MDIDAKLIEAEKNGTPIYGYSSKSIKIARILINHRHEVIRDYLSFNVDYSNQDFDMIQDLACWITDKQRTGELDI